MYEAKTPNALWVAKYLFKTPRTLENTVKIDTNPQSLIVSGINWDTNKPIRLNMVQSSAIKKRLTNRYGSIPNSLVYCKRNVGYSYGSDAVTSTTTEHNSTNFFS
jgi:hypothetical protein